MIPNIVRGDNPVGLMAYLAGGGRHNEHTDQHLIAGHGIDAWKYEDTNLSARDASDIGRMLNDPAKLNGVSIKQGHIWHCSLSVPKEDGILDDDEWSRIAEQFLHGMGLDDAEGTKAPLRWAAVRHGCSREGNDHIHIAVDLVREDGTKAFLRYDYRKAQQVCRELEREHGLTQVGNDIARSASRGYQQGELEARARRRARSKFQRENPRLDWRALPSQEKARLVALQLRQDQPRETLSLRIRAAAARSGSEAEFVRRLRRQGVLVRPRFATNTTNVVTGYSVAEKPVYGEKPIWYGGGTIARDLRLSRLRESCGWQDSVAAAGEAADEWMAAFRGRRAAHPHAGEQAPQPEAVARAIARLNGRLRMVPVDDRATWARVAHETAGALASWSRAVEPTPGPIAKAAMELSRSAQTYRKPGPPVVEPRRPMSETAMAFTVLAAGGRGRMSSAIMLRQLFRTTIEIRKAMEARHEARQAALLLSVQEHELMDVAGRLPPVNPANQRTAANPSAEVHTGAAGRERKQGLGRDDLVDVAHAVPSKATLSREWTKSPRERRGMPHHGIENQAER